MPWTKNKQGGFTRGKPWLPVPSDHRDICVAAQERNPQSALCLFRSFMAWRRGLPALKTGTIAFLDTQGDRQFCFIRQKGKQRVLCAFNFSRRAARINLPAELSALTGNTFFDAGALTGKITGSYIALPAFGILCLIV
jgi:alpha-glucosidase